ncbi:DUF4902 domain-containing protein [Variovorax sp. J22R133]|uniref:DUF4902 domain-containing protein n=1 Tax=Variovorax brevis TaxID=3053503 RepID=UPI002578D4D4|nr:DUF4902 domain-containing protein [Variovorax sp. J22R133]MDM0110902.1 DUF4902 domain-containing protein [Variovorax sp. J22R133]
MLPLAPDGLLRLRRQDLSDIELVHLISGIDDHDPAPAPTRCGAATTLSGYTEWVGASEPRVSLGWDWQLDTASSVPRVIRLGLPRTNVQVVGEAHSALPWDESLEVLASWIDAIDWNTPAFHAVCRRYAL